jgi:Cof subfamily protein (haloacid dehalogenase superfamily)
MQKIALVAVDLDGTLLTSQSSLAPRGATALQRAARQGVRVVLATTRNPESVLPFCRTLGLADPLICTNGAQVWGSPTGPVWAHHTIPLAAALAIAGQADAHGWELSTTVGEMTYWRQRPGQALGPIFPHVTVVPANTDAIVGEPLRFLAHQPQAIKSLHALCQSSFSGRCRIELFYQPDGSLHSLGIFAPQADKGTALALVLARLKIEPERVMAIGDNLNDLPMFPYASLRVAVGNGVDQLKREATVVAPSNDDEGVAWALEKYVLFNGQDDTNDPPVHAQRAVADFRSTGGDDSCASS